MKLHIFTQSDFISFESAQIIKVSKHNRIRIYAHKKRNRTTQAHLDQETHIMLRKMNRQTIYSPKEYTI